ncbi:hypothetical protein HYH03_008274 [Edaphochlamys debaryana]|uniref:Uncharacterized protein n=1 Tax=Edaphochlamys debaryana TaxID=47281 RepID=A0A835XYK9_9CHLO|nr:hypothetical protein HYH03_008274 [Edaphochlamys debaryana]|eukprot:KAG2493457.1 hypothetical protein HYH03_008274 [Edaphochlamys debaryana]
MTKVLLKYTIISHDHYRGDPAKRYFELACPDEGVARMLVGELASPLQPSSHCANDSAAFAEYGMFGELDWSLADIAKNVLKGGGWCGMNPAYRPYGRWLKRNRLARRRGHSAPDALGILR